jgi:hypothetical protein
MKRLFLPLILFAPATAPAEPPWEVDDPGVTAHGTTTLYFAYRTERGRRERQDALSLPALTYGLTKRLELGVGLDALHSSGPDLGRATGWGDVGMSLKLLVAGTPDEPDLALAYQATLPSGSRFATAGSVGHSFWLTGQARSGRGRLTANAGATLATRGTEATLFYGAVLDAEAGPCARCGLQLSGSGPARGGRHDLRAALGATRQAGERLAFQALVGKSLTDGRRWHAYLGFTLDAPGGGR